jgi:hypothetical protein
MRAKEGQNRRMVREAVSADARDFHPDRFKLPEVRVSAPTSWRSIEKGQQGDASHVEAAGQLGQQALILARKAQSGNTCQISAGLDSCRPEHQLSGAFLRRCLTSSLGEVALIDKSVCRWGSLTA